MKQILLLIFTLAVISGCTKSAVTKVTKTTPVTTLSGIYVSYKNVDTTYHNGVVSQGIQEITVETAYGDTTYSNPGTPYLKIGINIIANYNPALITTDSLKFTSATQGIMSQPQDSFPFTYSLKTGVVDDGQGPDSHNKLVRLDDNNVELITWYGDPTAISDVSATYYLKKH